MTTDTVSVVVMSRNRWSDLRRTLAEHEGPVILVDNGSTDDTPGQVRQHFPDVQVIPLRTNLGAPARNVGVSAARTPYVAFADDDSWWSPGALARAADLFEAHPRLAVIAARVLVGPAETLDPVCRQLAEAPLGQDDDLPGPSVLGFLACGVVVRRDAFLSVGGFSDLLFFAGEEELLALDLASRGWGMAYVEELVAHHHPSSQGRSSDREVVEARNRVLTAVLRRPWAVVASTLKRESQRGAAGRRGVRRAVPRLPRALRMRRTLPAELERARRRLDRSAPVQTY